ncbi:hypothetical protein [Deinococcus sp.]|uniref:hypothetical protein n=1 Tax=Deinococcus sp. TaxID=47478 RepID=UPI0025BD1D23|nr:hypothetical protein [Deinococcus sp.]
MGAHELGPPPPPQEAAILGGMVLWLVVVAIVLSATLILGLSLGPLKTAANVGTIRLFAYIQYAAAALLAALRLLGKA